MSGAYRWAAYALLGVACGAEEGLGPPPPVDVAVPTADAARFLPLPGGDLRLEIDASDEEGGCGVAAVRAVVVGPGVGRPWSVDLRAGEDGWYVELSADRCAEAGSVTLGGLAVVDHGGNEREFRPAMGEEALQATDHDVTLARPWAELGARRGPPRLTGVSALGPGRIEVLHDGGDCGEISGEIRALGPNGDRIRLAHAGTPEPGRERFEVADAGCLAEGVWQPDELSLVAPGGGVFMTTDVDLLPTFEVSGTGLSERLPVAVESLSLEPDGAQAIRVKFDVEDASCAVTEMSGTLRRLEEGDPGRHVATFGADGVAVLPPCAGPGSWWLSRLVLADKSGGVWAFRLRTDDVSLGYREAPELTPPSLHVPR